MTPIAQMAAAVSSLAGLKRNHLCWLEELTRNEGFEPGADIAFGGIRLVIARAEATSKFLGRLAPHETALLAWLAERERPPETAVQAASASSVAV